MKAEIEKNNDLAQNEIILEINFELFMLMKDIKSAFIILVKMKSNKVFDFLRKTQLDFELSKFLPKLLLFNSSATVDYLI